MKLYRKLINKLRSRSGADAATVPAHRRDLQEFVVDEDVRLQVYWKNNRNGFGTVLIARAKHHEIAKFDCLGGADGHFHAPPDFQSRISFREASIEAQIGSACDELRNRLQDYLSAHHSQALGGLVIPRDRLEAQLELVEARMLYLLDTVPGMKSR